MILRHDDSFYIEHGSRRRGYYNARSAIHDAGRADHCQEAVYRADHSAELSASYAYMNTITPDLNKYLYAAIIDRIVTHGQYVEWFGSTQLLVKFSKRLLSSRAWVGCIEFSIRDPRVALFDVYHELAHHVTIRHGEPYHGERFRGAYLLIASLSPISNHARHLALQFRKEGLYPYNNPYFMREFAAF